jgi:hypothetical protein
MPALYARAVGTRQNSGGRHRTSLNIIKDDIADVPVKEVQPTFVCPECGAAMIIVEILARKPLIRAPPTQAGAP